MVVHSAYNSPLEAASQCAGDVSRFFLVNGTLLNPNKTEAVLFWTRAQRKKIDTSAGIDVTGIQPIRQADGRHTRRRYDARSPCHRNHPRLQIPYADTLKTYSAAQWPAHRQDGRARGGTVTTWLLQRPAVWNIHIPQEHWSFAGRSEYIGSRVETCVKLPGCQAPWTCADRFIGCQLFFLNLLEALLNNPAMIRQNTSLERTKLIGFCLFTSVGSG